MTNKRVLIVSTTILITTTIIVAIFGIVPLPNYGDLSSENNFDGKDTINIPNCLEQYFGSNKIKIS